MGSERSSRVWAKTRLLESQPATWLEITKNSLFTGGSQRYNDKFHFYNDKCEFYNDKREFYNDKCPFL